MELKTASTTLRLVKKYLRNEKRAGDDNSGVVRKIDDFVFFWMKGNRWLFEKLIEIEFVTEVNKTILINEWAAKRKDENA